MGKSLIFPTEAEAKNHLTYFPTQKSSESGGNKTTFEIFRKERRKNYDKR